MFVGGLVTVALGLFAALIFFILQHINGYIILALVSWAMMYMIGDVIMSEREKRKPKQGGE